MSSGKGFRKSLCSAATEKGVTLLELIITISIIGIITSLVVYKTSAIQRYRLQQDLISLQADIRFARHISINENINSRVLLDDDNLLYHVQKETDRGYASIKTVSLSNCTGMSINRYNNYVEYTPRGTTSDACTILLFNEEYCGEMTVNVGSGRVKIKDIYKI